MELRASLIENHMREQLQNPDFLSLNGPFGMVRFLRGCLLFHLQTTQSLKQPQLGEVALNRWFNGKMFWNLLAIFL